METPMNTFPKMRLKKGVAFTDAKITRIVTRVLESHRIDGIRELEDDESSDTRSYVITLKPCMIDGREFAILKVAGDLFGAERIRNEVANLLFLERACPTLPVPEVWGWCQDKMGRGHLTVVLRFMGRLTALQPFPHPENDDSSTERAWVLLTMVPGCPLGSHDLEGADGERFVKEAARLTAGMRQKIGSFPSGGNQQLMVAGHMYGTSEDFNSPTHLFYDFGIGGILEHPGLGVAPCTSALQYYFYRLSQRWNLLHSLRAHGEGLEPTIEQLLKRLRELIDVNLPALLRLRESSEMIFTQVHVSFENFLISGSSPSIRGLVNFEYAGFFPPEVEFSSSLNDIEVGEPYVIYLKELERLGVKTPLGGYSSQEWEISKLLMSVINLVGRVCCIGDSNTDVWYRRQPGQPEDAGLQALECIGRLEQILLQSAEINTGQSDGQGYQRPELH